MELEVIRPKRFHDKLRDYKLLVDGVKVATIKPNSSTRVTLPENSEYIQACIDWCSSPKLYIKDLTAKQIYIGNTMPRRVLSTLFLSLYYITFGRKQYLTIDDTYNNKDQP